MTEPVGSCGECFESYTGDVPSEVVFEEVQTHVLTEDHRYDIRVGSE